MPPRKNWNRRSDKPKRHGPPKKQETSSEASHQQTSVEGMRLNKYVAHCGVASRRQSAELVKTGKVTVNGEVKLEPYYQVKEGDEIRYEGKLLQPESRLVYILLNKPRDIITTTSDERGRDTVLDLISDKVKERVFPVGRLDRDTTGLLLLTNDGDLAQKLAHPSHEIEKVYEVTLDKEVSSEHLRKIREGLTLEDGPAPVDAAHYVDLRTKDQVRISIHIGRNRIVRRIFEHLGYEVKKLDRVYYAGLTKKDLPRGFSRPLTEREIVMLKHFR